MKIAKKKSNNLDFQEVIDTPETEIVEENITLDESFIKNRALIRMDMNIIQYPIFSKNTKRKTNQIVKYYFNNNRDTYITVTPASGYHIPGEMEEKVFIVLMKIMKDKGMPQKFWVTLSELKKELGLNTNRANELIKKSLLRIANTFYSFKNTMYFNELKSVLKEEITRSIFELDIVSLERKENEKIKAQINDRRIKEIYQIKISDFFYKNILAKGYLVYDAAVLLDIESSTARTIYMLIEKLRFNEIYLKIDVIYLIKRIPLKFDKSNIGRTVKTLIKSFQELKDKNLIKNFILEKNGTWETAEVEVFFYDFTVHDKQQRFFDDLNEFRQLSQSQLLVSHTENKDLKDENEKNPKEFIVVTLEMIEQILDLMPLKARTLKTMPKTIKDSIDKYGLEKVQKVAIYMKKNKVDKVRAYFIKALENDWTKDEDVSEFFLIKQSFDTKDEITQENTIEIIETTNEDKNLETLEKYNQLREEEKLKIEEEAYKHYIKKCGQDTKIQKIAFKAGKTTLICNYLKENNYFNKDLKNKIIPLNEDKKNRLELAEVYLSINEKINFYSGLLNMNSDQEMALKLEVGKEILLRKNLAIISEEEIVDMVRLVVLKINNLK
ncbi:hypothetical protein [Candidatus Cetobacterium colombiensis]|uniref:Replication initiator protein A n=1 Tax=Candidatus Cetobacterium colombiensis TaxID=3073100 RepID=A0ABU4W9D6_9FUSO|nr:hypothetical protein [Candidatus Cetobacterium colombiensis]MDX8336137.1 hypothetical protein [Candidatus Cetobacterium colombiensis]